MGTEARMQHMKTEKLEVYLLCKRVRSKGKPERVRRKTCRELRNRLRRAGGKGHGRAFCDYR